VRVVEIAKREINGKTDIAFEYEQIKEGRKVTALRFVITKNRRDTQADNLRDDPKLSRLISRLTAHGMTEDKAVSYVRDYPSDLIEWATEEITRRLKSKKEKIDNPAGWLCRAIEEDWRPQKTLFDIERAERMEDAKKLDARKAELSVVVEKVRAAHKAYTIKTITQYLDGLAEDDRQTLNQAFREHLDAKYSNGLATNQFDGGASWYSNPWIRAEATVYLPAHRPDFPLVSIAEFASRNGVEDFNALEGEYKALTR